MSTYQVGDKVSKVNVNGKVGSASVYEVATVTAVADLEKFSREHFERDGVDTVYTLRKVGGRGKGGCWYTESQLVPAED